VDTHWNYQGEGSTSHCNYEGEGLMYLKKVWNVWGELDYV